MKDDLQTRLAETQTELELAKAHVAQLASRLAEMTLSQESQTLSQKQLLQRLEIVHRLDIAILSADSLENLAQMALTHVIQLVPCFRASISIVDLTVETAFILALHSDVETPITAGKIYPLDEKYIAGVTNAPYVVENNVDLSSNPNIQQLYREGIRSILLVPMRVENNLVGLLSLHSVQAEYFTDEKIQIAIEVAHQIAIGIDKKTRSDELARYAQRMEILHAIDLGIIQGGSVKALVANTLKQVQRLIPCERIAIGLIEQATQEMVAYIIYLDDTSGIVEGMRFPLPPDLLKELIDNHVRLVKNMHETDDAVFKLLVQEGFQSYLQILLGTESANIGTIGFASKTLNFFTSQHQEIAIEVAAQLSIALHQMQLAEALERHASQLEQRVAERTSELQVSKDQIEAILQNSLDGILLIDRDLRIQQANPAVSRLLLKQLSNKERVNLLDLVHPDYADRIRTSIEQTLLEQNPIPIEVQANDQNGRKRDIEISFGHIPDDGFVSTLHDITTRKQAEAALKKALDMERELVVARTHFMSVATHEFRTPLATILAAADTLSNYRDRLDAVQIDQKLERIRQNVWHMTSLMEDTLQLSRIQSGRLDYRPVSADLDALCHTLIEEFEELSAGKNRFVYTSTSSPLMVSFDQRLMKQVMSNLFSNALKYSSADKSVKVALSQESSQVIFSVSDQGIGIPDEDLKHLFEPFHRASNTGSISGTGLGLSITKQIVEYHRGEIRVDSHVGQGTTFTVLIPAS